MVLFAAHSGTRYLVMVLGVLALAYALYGWATNRPYDRTMKILAAAFAGVVHLQVVLGFGVLFTRTFFPALTGHLFMMLFAAAAAQIPSSVMRRRPAERRTWPPHVIGTALALLLIAGGIMAIGRPLFGSTVG